MRLDADAAKNDLFINSGQDYSGLLVENGLMTHVLRRVLTACAVVLAVMAWRAGPAQAQEFTPEQKAEIESIIGDYLRKNPDFVAEYLRENPEILIEVSEILRARAERQKREAAAYALKAHRDKLERHPMTPASGNDDGDVTVVEFFDYQCPYCKRVFTYMTELEREDENLRVVWKEFPILGPVSRFAARAATAADRQGKYMEFHTALMSAPGRLTEARVLKLAEAAGIDIDRLKEDMDAPEIEAYLDETIALGNALGITGTPGFVIGDEVVSGAIPKREMQKRIDLARQNGS